MSDIKEKIRRLIDKAKESGDVDLLDLAMDLLDHGELLSLYSTLGSFPLL